MIQFVVVVLEMDLGMKKVVNLSVCASPSSIYHSSPLGKLKPSRSEGEMNLNKQTCHNMVQPFLAGSFSPHGQPEISIVFLFTCRNFRLIPMAEGMLCGIFMDSKSFNKTDYLIQIEKENNNSIAIISP